MPPLGPKLFHLGVVGGGVVYVLTMVGYNPRGPWLLSPWFFQVRILEWVAIPFSKGSSRPRDRTQVSCTAGRFFPI